MSSLFVVNTDINKNAYPNWRRSTYPNENFCSYSEMFKSSADDLIDTIGSNLLKKADEIINPAIFLYRHSIELMLKALLVTHYLLENADHEKIQKKLDGHFLESLWSKTENIIRIHCKQYVEQDSKTLKAMREAVLELHNIDKDSTIFRYPFDNKLNVQKIGDEQRHYAIDYTNLKNNMNDLFVFLLGCYHVVYDKYENQDVIRVF
ncbi:hypothetical protein [Tumebacillus permanentifrigoris]|uniref:Uncharacterized protein n=1 Tax=Tumebacillus permanentifrigoris TaxID=378543 RepID=A0A316D838_9BACL|nr:hypothetical protein [Tumebacillus permanentifrigoris]PWK06240.1 hypothetical protein C7459_1201 [Tumebacillus permanentifrigoris]